MKIKKYREKWAKYDPIAWSRCNICHQKHPEKTAVHVHAGLVVSSSEMRMP